MRFKNFSNAPIAYSAETRAWTHENHPGSFIQVVARSFVEPGEITDDFDPEDPIVQLMLKAHPELRPLVVCNAWQKILDGVL